MDRISRRTLLKRSGWLAGGLALAGDTALAPRLAAAGSRSDLDGFVEAHMREAGIPGMGAALTRGDRILWARGYGRRNLAHGTPVTSDTPFMLASVSKTVVVVAYMQLVEAGLCGLDHDVNDLLPVSIRNPDFPARPITPRMLMTHTSGIRDNWTVLSDWYTKGDSPLSLSSFCQGYLVQGGGLYSARKNYYDAAPGTRYRYSNVGVALLGYLAQEAGGADFSSGCHGRIFDPLGMRNTAWFMADLDKDDVAMPYRVIGRDRVAQGFYGYPDYPDGQLRSSAPDMARFLGAFVNEGWFERTRILHRSTVRRMRRAQIPNIEAGQGLVWYALDARVGRLIGHNGGDKGVTTNMFYRPRDDVGVVTLANASGPGVYRAVSRIQNRLFEEAR